MQRKKLIDLPIQKNRDDIPTMLAVEEKTNEGVWGKTIYKKYNFCYDAFIDKSTDEDVLIVDFFTPFPQSEFIFRLFQTANKWFFVDDNGKISERSLFCNKYHYFFEEEYHPFNKSTDVIIGRYIKKHSHYSFDFKDYQGINQISAWQDKIRDKKRQQKYDRIKDSVSMKMLELRPLPKNVEKWIDNSAMKEYRYMFYDASKRKNTVARCSHCGETVDIETPKRNMQTICPNCKSLCVAKPYKAYLNSNGFYNSTGISYLQPLKNKDFCIRIFNIRWNFHENATPSKHTEEMARIFCHFKHGHIEVSDYFQHEPGYQGGDWRKYQSSVYSGINQLTQVYPGTLNKVFKMQPNFKRYHIDFNKIARLCNPITVKGLYFSTTRIEFIQNLVNSGLTNLARSIINNYGNFNFKGYDISKGSLSKGCGITKDDLPYLKKLNPDASEVELIKVCQAKRLRPDISTMRAVFSIKKKTGLTTNQFQRILKYSSPGKFVKYFNYIEKSYLKKKEYKYSWQTPYYNFMYDFMDYLEYAVLLEYNLKNHDVLYPKDFKYAHDTTYKIVNDKNFKKAELPQIARQFQKNNTMYSYEYKDLFIRPPKCHNELKKEGEKLNHCVASYAIKVATEKTIILLIRKKNEPDIPYFTLELNPDTYEIIQNRGKNNCSYPTEVKCFMEKWYEEKIEPLKRRNEKCLKKTA